MKKMLKVFKGGKKGFKLPKGFPMFNLFN